MKFKILRKTVASVGKTFFAEGKPFSFFYPLFEAADTFFFTPDKKTTGTCHVRDCNDFKRMMIAVVYALIPCALMGMYNVGLQANLLIRQAGFEASPADWHGAVLRWLNTVIPALGLFDATSILGCFV